MKMNDKHFEAMRRIYNDDFTTFGLKTVLKAADYADKTHAT